jgi:DNA polymerase I-like protein with 3'-5' exonuclease and polymerase domains
LFNGKQRGNPRFDKKTLSRYDNPLATKILECRHIKTLLSLFIHPYPELMVDDRLHCQFNQLKSDNYGTVSGRFSSSNPNLQQVSAKKEEDIVESTSSILNGQVIRKLFLPEEGCKWIKYDWSQIEYRLIAHYAIGEGADLIRKRYTEDANTDYHDEMGKLTGIEDRKIVKTLNFGAAYGMGIEKMSETYGWNLEEAKAIYYMYHSRVPFVKETSNRVALKAKKMGFIKTILGRRAHLKSSSKAYVMFNRLIQGSAADLMKLAMVQGYKSGIFNTLYPHLTVHDEMDISEPEIKEGREASKEFKNIMENCVKLKVPIIAEMEIGENWGELEKVKI